MRVGVWVLAASAIVFAGAAHADGQACPRPRAGSVIAEPSNIYSKDGVLDVAFDYRTRLDNRDRTLFCFMTPDGTQSPALHLLPGDTLRIHLTNRLPDIPLWDDVVTNAEKSCGARRMTPTSVNIHFHGTNTSPTCHQDEVIHTLVNPGETFVYSVHIPADEPPGLYWYHTHVHGINNQELLGGASGPLIVEGIDKYQPAVRNLPRRILAFRDERLGNPMEDIGDTKKPSFDVSLNYVPVLYPGYTPGVLRMRAGVEEFWRVVNASADTSADLQLVYDGAPQTLRVVAFDGVPLGWPQRHQGEILRQNHVFLPPAGRAEFIVAGPSDAVKNAMLITLPGNTGTGFREPRRPLALIKTTRALDWLGGGAERSVPQENMRFDGLANAPVTAQRRLYFSENPQGTKFYITVVGQQPKLYQPDEAPRITTTHGAVEDWTIENRTTEVHVFHIHQIHFLLLAVNGKPVPKDKQQMFDTHEVDYWSGKGPYPNIKVRMDFRGPIVGEFVYHCHITDHSDHGMMANIRVLPNKADLLGAAQTDAAPQ